MPGWLVPPQRERMDRLAAGCAHDYEAVDDARQDHAGGPIARATRLPGLPLPGSVTAAGRRRSCGHACDRLAGRGRRARAGDQRRSRSSPGSGAGGGRRAFCGCVASPRRSGLRRPRHRFGGGLRSPRFRNDHRLLWRPLQQQRILQRPVRPAIIRLHSAGEVQAYVEGGLGIGKLSSLSGDDLSRIRPCMAAPASRYGSASAAAGSSPPGSRSA